MNCLQAGKSSLYASYARLLYSRQVFFKGDTSRRDASGEEGSVSVKLDGATTPKNSGVPGLQFREDSNERHGQKQDQLRRKH